MTQSPDDNEIYLLGKRVSLRQIPGGFRPGLDSVMLAAACPVKESESVLDLGCGVGSAGLCVLTRMKDTTLIGVDIQADHIECAAGNAGRNDMQARCTFIQSCISAYEGEACHHVICNPPYEDAGAHVPSPSESRATAMGHQNADIDLKDWVDCARDHIKGRGTLTMIHKAGMVDKIIRALGKSFGRVEIIPLHPKTGEPAKRVIIRAVKNSLSPAIIHPGLIIHEEDGSYTAGTENILREAKTLY